MLDHGYDVYLYAVTSMNSKDTRVAMVGYLNTIPFVSGLRDMGLDPILDIPSRCLDYFIRGDVDIALVPVGALQDVGDDAYDIVSDFCIGCDGEVRTVCLMSHEPLADIHTIVLDSDSRTSVKLIKILCEQHWGIRPQFSKAPLATQASGVAWLKIGDKVFQEEGKYAYTYDLGAEWKAMTGMPFVFAVWIARKGLSLELVEAFNQALEAGIQSIGTADYSAYKDVDLSEYFTKHIKYTFGESQKKALESFLAYLASPV